MQFDKSGVLLSQIVWNSRYAFKWRFTCRSNISEVIGSTDIGL